MPNPVTGREAMESVLAIADRVLKHISVVRPETKSLKIRCPEGLAEFSVLLKPGLIRKHVMAKLHIPAERIVKMDLRTLRTFTSENQAIVESPTDFVIDLTKLNEESDSALLTIEYEIESEDVLKALVSRKWQADTVETGDEDRYWMHAQLKYLSALETEYGSVDLADVDVAVDVGIYERLRAALPTDFLRRVDALARLIRETDRNRRFRAVMDYVQVRKTRGGADDFAKLGEIQSVFTTRNFRSFVEVERPFVFSSAAPGRIGIDSAESFGVPKFVEVVSRTDLNLQRPAAEGHLLYKASKLKDHLSTIFEG